MSPTVIRMLHWRKTQGAIVLITLLSCLFGVAGLETDSLYTNFTTRDHTDGEIAVLATLLIICWSFTLIATVGCVRTIYRTYFEQRELTEANLVWFTSSRQFMASLMTAAFSTAVLTVFVFGGYLVLWRDVDMPGRVFFVISAVASTWMIWQNAIQCNIWLAKGIFHYREEIDRHQVYPLSGDESIRRPVLVRDATPSETQEFRRAMRRMSAYENLTTYYPKDMPVDQHRAWRVKQLKRYIDIMVLKRNPLQATTMLETTDATGRVYRGIQEGIQWRHQFFDDLGIAAMNDPDPVTVSVVPHQKEG